MGKSTPSAPDPTTTAAAQTQSNEQTAAYNQQLNMIDSSGPDGSVNYYTDASAPGGYGMQTTLSPQEQAIFNQQTSAESGALGVANDQLGRVSSALDAGFNPSTYGQVQTGVGSAGSQQAIQDAEDAAYKQQTQYLTPQFQQQQGQLTAQMAAQGLNPNDAADQNAQTLFGNQENQAYQGAASAAVQAGQQEQNTLYGQALQSGEFANTAQQQAFQQGAYAQELPINEFDSLLGSGQVATPTGISYTPAQAQSTNVAQIDQNSFQDQAANDAVTNKATNSALGGLFNLGAAFL